MSRDEAVAVLAIKPATLYTYVSRGLVRSIPTTGSRQRLFSRIDVEELMVRSKCHEGGAARAQLALRYGEPIITTSITNITSEGLFYRGHAAVELAGAGTSFEAVSELLWRGTMADQHASWRAVTPRMCAERLVSALHMSLPAEDALKLFPSIVLALGSHSEGLQDECCEGTMQSAREIIQTLASSCGFMAQPAVFSNVNVGDTIALTVARALNAKDLEIAVPLINSALILCADLELTPGTFAARVASSAGNDIYGCVAAGILVHSGGARAPTSHWCEEFLSSCTSGVEEKLALARKQGHRLPGFYNRIFPEGDPRAKALIEHTKKNAPLSKRTQAMLTLVDRVEVECNAKAGMAAALVVLQSALELPRHSAAALWALGRVAGQVAHVIEQRGQGFVIRPRAKYEPPTSPQTEQRVSMSSHEGTGVPA